MGGKNIKTFKEAISNEASGTLSLNVTYSLILMTFVFKIQWLPRDKDDVGREK